MGLTGFSIRFDPTLLNPLQQPGQVSYQLDFVAFPLLQYINEILSGAPGLMLLTGTLSVGHHEETDGRVSVVRLALDPPARGAGKTSSFTGKGAGLASSHPSRAR